MWKHGLWPTCLPRRYKQAQEILFGNDLDMRTRFNLKTDDEKGSILLHKIFEVYQDGERRTIPWFRDDGVRNVVRHPLNMRHTGGTTKVYQQRIYTSGIVDGVRGEPWLVFDSTKNQYLALTYGTLPPGRN